MIGLLIALCLASAALVLLHNWHLTVPLLLALDVLRIALLWLAAPPAAVGGGLLLAELATAIGVAATLLLSARRWAKQPLPILARPPVLMIGALVVAALASMVVVQTFSLSGARPLDAAVVFGVLCGLLALLAARDVLKLGLGLLLLAGSAKLLYFTTQPSLPVPHVALWEALSVGLALVTAIFCSLLYGRLYTLELGRLPDSEP